MVRRRLAKLLGLSLEETDVLATRARLRLGGQAYGVRMAAMLLATSPALRRLIPEALRRRAIRPFVYELVSGASENLLYARVESSGD